MTLLTLLSFVTHHPALGLHCKIVVLMSSLRLHKLARSPFLVGRGYPQAAKSNYSSVAENSSDRAAPGQATSKIVDSEIAVAVEGQPGRVAPTVNPRLNSPTSEDPVRTIMQTPWEIVPDFSWYANLKGRED